MSDGGLQRRVEQSAASLGLLLRRSCELRGDQLALVDDERSVGWNEFAGRVARLARGLMQIGMKRGDRVALLSENSARFIEAYFAVPWGGGVIAPINHRLSPLEIADILTDCGAEILIVDRTHAHVVDDLTGRIAFKHVVLAAPGRPERADWEGYEDLIAGAASMPDAGRSGDDVAALFYTSGSTGRPKGVMHSHANISAACSAVIEAYELDQASVALIAGPLFHVGATGLAIPVIAAAGALTILPRFDASLVLQRIERDKVTVTSAVPTMLRMLLEHPDCRRRDISSLCRIPFGGAPMPPALLAQLIEVMPQARFLHSYGMTETVSSCTCLPDSWLRPESAAAGKANSIGRALAGVELSIRDGSDGEVAAGTIGEIAVRGACVMRGYWNKEQMSAETLRGGWLHTGDLGYLDAEGFLYIVDRLKDMIISGGENVYPAEVEAAIYAFPGVSQCAVIGIPDPRWGEAVHAMVVPREGVELSEPQLLAHCRAAIARYKCPRRIEIRTKALPLNGTNKIDKPALRAPFWSGQGSTLV